VAPRACVRVYARVLVPPNLYIHAYIPALNACRAPRHFWNRLTVNKALCVMVLDDWYIISVRRLVYLLTTLTYSNPFPFYEPLTRCGSRAASSLCV